jgi:hypothetical protein
MSDEFEALRDRIALHRVADAFEHGRVPGLPLGVMMGGPDVGELYNTSTVERANWELLQQAVLIAREATDRGFYDPEGRSVAFRYARSDASHPRPLRIGRERDDPRIVTIWTCSCGSAPCHAIGIKQRAGYVRGDRLRLLGVGDAAMLRGCDSFLDQAR